MSLHLIISGAGLAGLSAAITTKLAYPDNRVTMLESAKELAEVGAGFQISPNSTRLFKEWGIYDILEPNATAPSTLSVRRYDGTKILAHEPNYQSKIMAQYGFPFWDLHRVDLQQVLVAKVKELGVDVRLSSRVIDLDLDAPAVTLENGEVIQGDVILCAEGLWSSTRSKFLRKPSKPLETGDLAYRLLLSTKDLTDPELQQWVKNRQVNFWIGPGSHVVGYNLRDAEMYNLVLLVPDDLPESVSKQPGDLAEMKELFKTWDPLLRRFLDQVDSVLKWKLSWLDTLPNWKNEKGTFVMAGDACHPMLPYLAQGANSSLEDGAVFGRLFAKVRERSQLQAMTSMYEQLRKERGEMIARETFKQREDFHMPDGAAQKWRDEIMIRQLGKEIVGDFPSRWTCPRIQSWLFGYDSYKEAEEAYSRNPF